MNKAELQKSFDAIMKLKNDYSRSNSDLNSKIRSLELDIDSLKRQKESILREGNQRADLLKNILSIIFGDAQPLSKFEVIRDLFLPQIKQHQEMNSRNYNQTYNYKLNFLSERIEDSQ